MQDSSAAGDILIHQVIDTRYKVDTFVTEVSHFRDLDPALRLKSGKKSRPECVFSNQND